MKDNILQCHGKSPDKQQFVKTMKVLAGFIKKNTDFPKDALSLYKKYELDIILEPRNLTDEEIRNNTNKLIWKAYIQLYIRRIEV